MYNVYGGPYSKLLSLPVPPFERFLILTISNTIIYQHYDTFFFFAQKPPLCLVCVFALIFMSEIICRRSSMCLTHPSIFLFFIALTIMMICAVCEYVQKTHKHTSHHPPQIVKKEHLFYVFVCDVHKTRIRYISQENT